MRLGLIPCASEAGLDESIHALGLTFFLSPPKIFYSASYHANPDNFILQIHLLVDI